MNITNDIITAYIDSLYKSGNPQLMELRQFAEDKHIPIILKETESLLLNILRIKHPERMLEIGAVVRPSNPMRRLTKQLKSTCQSWGFLTR